MSKYSELKKKYDATIRECDRLVNEHYDLKVEYIELKKKYDVLEHEKKWSTFPPLQEYCDGLEKKLSEKAIQYTILAGKYDDLVYNRFEDEYRNRPSTRCNCCPVPIKDETIWETMYGGGMAAERIAHWDTSNWECIMNSIANIHCCCMRCKKEQDDD